MTRGSIATQNIITALMPLEHTKRTAECLISCLINRVISDLAHSLHNVQTTSDTRFRVVYAINTINFRRLEITISPQIELEESHPSGV